MRSVSMREVRKNRSAMLRYFAIFLLMFVYFWPWYILLTRKSGTGEEIYIPRDGKTLHGGSFSGRQRIVAYIGVQTGFNDPGVQDNYNYMKRRAVLRETWFPADVQALDRLQQELGLVVRFVIGHSKNAAQESSLAQEEERHGAFLRLDLLEGYGNLPAKTLAFFQAVTAHFVAKYIVKVDDDAYLRVWAVPQAVKQWEALHADYIGCMKRGPIFKDPGQRWYEPQHGLLGDADYFSHSWGTIYVLSGRAASLVAGLDPSALRYFSNEDVTIGAWMLALNVTHYDDRRLCERDCSPSSVAVFDMPKCAGLCQPITGMAKLFKDPACQGNSIPLSEADLPLQPSIIWFRDL